MKQIHFAIVTLLTGALMVGGAQAFGGKKESRRHEKHKIIQNLPKDKEMLFHSAMRDLRDKNKVLHDQIKKKKDDLKSILTAKKFDQTSFDKNFTEMSKLKNQEAENLHQVIFNLASKFSQEERAVLAEILPHKGPKKGPHGPKDEGKHQKPCK